FPIVISLIQCAAVTIHVERIAVPPQKNCSSLSAARTRSAANPGHSSICASPVRKIVGDPTPGRTTRALLAGLGSAANVRVTPLVKTIRKKIVLSKQAVLLNLIWRAQTASVESLCSSKAWQLGGV